MQRIARLDDDDDDDVGSISRDAVRQSSQYGRAGSQCISILDACYLHRTVRLLSFSPSFSFFLSSLLSRACTLILIYEI